MFDYLHMLSNAPNLMTALAELTLQLQRFHNTILAKDVCLSLAPTYLWAGQVGEASLLYRLSKFTNLANSS